MRTTRIAHFRLALALTFGALLASHAAAATLTEDTTWTGTTSLDETVEVPAGITLRIDPGATIEIAPSVSILVSGRLLAEGTETDPIRFTRQPGSGSWDRIIFSDAENSVLRHCVVEFSDCEGDHKDYYDDKDSSCQPVESRPPRDYNEAIVVIASHVDIEDCIFQNLPDDGGNGEGDAIAVISDDPVQPGAATATIRDCQFLSIGQGVHTRYSYVLVEDCFFTDHHGDNDDVDLYGESDPPPLVRDNLFLDPAHDDMINPTRCSAVLIGNIIAGSDDHGIVLRDKGFPVLINNVIFDCSSAGIAVQNTCDALLINNTIYDCGRAVRFFDHTGRWGLPYCLTPGSGKATLINCAIWNCPTTFELTESPAEADHGSHVSVRYSNIIGSQSRISISGASSTVTWGDGNLDVEPMFVNPANGDFHLQVGSPLIDAGSTEQAPATDLDGNARPCGDGIDIGATEYGDCIDPQPIEPRFRRGETNGDGEQDVSDAVFVLIGLFAGGPQPTCEKSADANDDGGVNIADAMWILAYLFQLGAPPPGPFPACGVDGTEDELTCESYAPCDPAE